MFCADADIPIPSAFRAVEHDLLTYERAGTIYVAGPPSAKHIVFFVGGFRTTNAHFCRSRSAWPMKRVASSASAALWGQPRTWNDVDVDIDIAMNVDINVDMALSMLFFSPELIR